ncbi:flagellar biosynthesis regulator FlaF [Paracoccaceae bacterium GXU_MW_L88]
MMSQDPVLGYQAIKTTLPDPRDTEYRAFAKCTADLSACLDASATFSQIATAIGKNRDLWRLLAADVLHEKNKLPADLRARLIYLQEFTQHHSSKVLKGEADLTALVEINTAVMRGLRANLETAV